MIICLVLLFVGIGLWAAGAAQANRVPDDSLRGLYMMPGLLLVLGGLVSFMFCLHWTLGTFAVIALLLVLWNLIVPDKYRFW